MLVYIIERKRNCISFQIKTFQMKLTKGKIMKMMSKMKNQTKRRFKSRVGGCGCGINKGGGGKTFRRKGYFNIKNNSLKRFVVGKKERRRRAMNGGAEEVAPVSRTAWSTVSKIGTTSANFWPPLPGVTPATSLVP